MAGHSVPLTILPMNPFRAALALVGYLGRLAILSTMALRESVVHPASVLSQTVRQLDRLFAMGLPMVGLVHVGMGSFLSMQAYFGATFEEGIGPVTGVGLIRNLAPLLTGFLLSGLIAARYVPELRRRDDPEIDYPRLVAPRLIAAMVAGTVLSVWGSLVGIAIGWLVANSMMAVTLPAFFDLFLEMLWTRDIVGLVVKGSAFGFIAALLACHEGLRRFGANGHHVANDPEAIGSAVCRVACLASLIILIFNAGWFLLVYHAGPAFGPTVLTPP